MLAHDKAKRDMLYQQRLIDTSIRDRGKLSRLCVVACNDQEIGLFSAGSFIKGTSLCVIIALALVQNFNLRTGDEPKAFVV